MFFISGYFGLKSLAKRSQGSFWKSKLVRIGVPWITGAVFIAPVIAYLMTQDIFSNGIVGLYHISITPYCDIQKEGWTNHNPYAIILLACKKRS